MSKKNHGYTTIQVKKEVNEHIKTFCKKYNVSASAITELMWANYISSSIFIKKIMTMDDTAKHHLLEASSIKPDNLDHLTDVLWNSYISSSMSGSISLQGQ
jgi:hypothetical protein